MSWAALGIGEFYDGEKDEWRIKDRRGRTLTYEVAVDELGYPMPLRDDPARHSRRTLEIADADEVWERLQSAASGATADVRDAVADIPDDEEVDAWWSAHMGAPLLPRPVSVEVALSQSLSRSTEREAAGPSILPDAARIHRLLSLTRRVSTVGH